MRTAGRYDSHTDRVRGEAHVKERAGMRVERGAESQRRVSDAGSDLDAMLMRGALG